MRYLVYRGGYKSLEGLIMFEDNENSPLSHLYSFNSEKKALYANGAPFIEGELLNIVPEKDLFIFVMYDISIGNNETINIFHKIMKLQSLIKNRFIILPILSAEYHFLKAFYMLDIIPPEDNTILDEIEKFRSSKLLTTIGSIKDRKSSEKYCKFLIRESLKRCISTDSRFNSYKYFYENDCKMSDYKDLTLKQKSDMYQEAFPIKYKKKSFITSKEIYELHKNLVIKYNSIIERWKTIEPLSMRSLSPMQEFDSDFVVNNIQQIIESPASEIDILSTTSGSQTTSFF